MTNPGPLPITRPQDCPACTKCKNPGKEGCGLLTLSASQLGAVVALVFGCMSYLFQLLGARPGNEGVGLTGRDLASNSQERMFTEQFWAILFLTALYYAVAEWALEEQDFGKLRTLAWPQRVPFPLSRVRLPIFEFWLRVGLAGIFGVAAAGIPEIFRTGLSSIHASFILLAIIYLLFLFWDLIVYEGGQKEHQEIVDRVVWYDFGGAILILLCLWTHHRWPDVATFLIMITACLAFIKLWMAAKNVHLLSRILDRDGALR